MGFIKNVIKHYFSGWIHRSKCNPAIGVQQRALSIQYKHLQHTKQLPKFNETGFKVFSQFEEDGLLHFIFSLLGEGSKKCVEIGANDGINSNCANLVYHFGWSALFLEGSQTCIDRGKRFYKKRPTPYHTKPIYEKAIIQRENINQLLEKHGFVGEIDLLSIDIDGNDYWVWDGLTVAQPKVVIIETHTEFGLNDIVVPYDKNYMFPGKHPVYHGASVVAMHKLAERKGYRLIGANDLGFNQIYIRKDLLLNEIASVSPESTLWHQNAKDAVKSFEAVKDWDFLPG